MRINKEKRIGNVLFIVEGSHTEFSYLKKIFCGLLGYSYLEKRRNKLTYFNSERDPYSKVAVINTRESNIKDISENRDYLDEVFQELQNRYHFPVFESAIYYLFDRDPLSNTDAGRIENYIYSLSDPHGESQDFLTGQLLLSYPSVESYAITSFIENARNLRFMLGADAKTFIGQHKEIQINKMSDETIIRAAQEFMEYLSEEHLEWDIDNFSSASYAIFTKQERNYLSGEGFRVFSMLTLAFLQMGLLDFES